ncbi:hypothetical protein H4R19_003081 [Coemansia spiralis]|nr:hypothetical protein H4R19_003081 [Coemansia spiralis]
MRRCFKLLVLAAALMAGSTDVTRAQVIAVPHGAAASSSMSASVPAAAVKAVARPATSLAPSSTITVRPASSSTAHSMWEASTSLAVEALFAVAVTPITPSKAAMHQRPDTTASSAAAATSAQRPGGHAGAGGGVIPPAAPVTPVIFTATHGPGGGVLEYGSCIAFESQCNALCSLGVHSMGCSDGGLCLCYGDDMSTDSADEYTGATDQSASDDDSAAHAQFWRTSAWGVCVAAALAWLWL